MVGSVAPLTAGTQARDSSLRDVCGAVLVLSPQRKGGRGHGRVRAGRAGAVLGSAGPHGPSPPRRQVHDYLRSKLCSLYENDCIFDKFECVWNGSDR